MERIVFVDCSFQKISYWLCLEELTACRLHEDVRINSSFHSWDKTKLYMGKLCIVFLFGTFEKYSFFNPNLITGVTFLILKPRSFISSKCPTISHWRRYLHYSNRIINQAFVEFWNDILISVSMKSNLWGVWHQEDESKDSTLYIT